MAISLILALTLAAPEAQNRCSVFRTGEMYVRELTETWAVGSVLRSVPPTSKLPPRVRHETEAEGHMVRIESALGYGVGTVFAPGDSVVVFLWVVTADCSWLTRGKVLADSSRHHFAMTLRPDSMWVDARPTFDVVPDEGLTVYPAGSERARFTVHEFAEFASLIPTRSEWNADCRPGVRRTNQWLRARLGPLDMVAFPEMIESLVGACEYKITRSAHATIRKGPRELPTPIETWAAQADCGIRSPKNPWSSYNAVRGQFTPDVQTEQWAVICARGNMWRLLVVAPAEGRVLAELGSFIGSDVYWTVEAVSPGYFTWAPLSDDELAPSVSPPTFDAILLNSGYIIFWSGSEWLMRADTCCGVNH